MNWADYLTEGIDLITIIYLKLFPGPLFGNSFKFFRLGIHWLALFIISIICLSKRGFTTITGLSSKIYQFYQLVTSAIIAFEMNPSQWMLGWDIFVMSSKEGLYCFSSTSDHYIISVSFCYSTRNSQSYQLRWALTYQNKLDKSRTRRQSISFSPTTTRKEQYQLNLFWTIEA